MAESKMVERVALALFGRDVDRDVIDPPWGDNTSLHESYYEEAELAINAMRDPTKMMLNAAAGAMSPGKRPTPDQVSVKEKYRIRFQAMIDAALSK